MIEIPRHGELPLGSCATLKTVLTKLVPPCGCYGGCLGGFWGLDGVNGVGAFNFMLYIAFNRAMFALPHFADQSNSGQITEGHLCSTPLPALVLGFMR